MFQQRFPLPSVLRHFADFHSTGLGSLHTDVSGRTLAIVNPLARPECTVFSLPLSLSPPSRNSYVARRRRKDYEPPAADEDYHPLREIRDHGALVTKRTGRSRLRLAGSRSRPRAIHRREKKREREREPVIYARRFFKVMLCGVTCSRSASAHVCTPCVRVYGRSVAIRSTTPQL